MNMFQRKPLVLMESSEQSHWTLETLRMYIFAIIAANEVKYSERFSASQDAINAAFLAQQTAMQTALIAQKQAVDIALGVADRAVAKAETAVEKRFESVDEFRATLSDQQNTFIPRGEATVLFKSIVDEKLSILQIEYNGKIEVLRVSFERSDEGLAKEIASLCESRSETSGKSAGVSALWGYVVAIASMAVALWGYVVAIASMAVALIFHFVK